MLSEVEVKTMIDGVEQIETIRQSLPVGLLVAIGIGVGAVIGLINGVVIAYGNVLPIVTTLGMQYIVYGACHVISGSQAVYKKDMSEAFVQFTRVEPL
ncbi:MAG: hypothetical protein RR843_12560, partial [Clostridia bacterium]